MADVVGAQVIIEGTFTGDGAAKFPSHSYRVIPPMPCPSIHDPVPEIEAITALDRVLYRAQVLTEYTRTGKFTAVPTGLAKLEVWLLPHQHSRCRKKLLVLSAMVDRMHPKTHINAALAHVFEGKPFPVGELVP